MGASNAAMIETAPPPLEVEKNLVAIVDGNERHRAQLSSALLSFYRMVEYPDSLRAMAALGIMRPQVLVVGEETPIGGGYALVRKLRLLPEFQTLPIIMIVGKDDQNTRDSVRQCGASSFLVKPYRRSTLIRAISSLVNSKVEQSWEILPPTQRKALKGTVEIYNSISDVIERGEPIAYSNVTDACAPLVEAVNTHDFKTILSGVKDHDNYSYAHSLRVATLLSLFGNVIGLPESEQLLLASGGLLHDVGKMSIPHEVLNKPGRLTEDEFVVMKSHVDHSVHYLKANPEIPKGVITIAEQHHEKLDGTGYPNRIPGNKLNELARMAAIVDVFGALTDRRVYKPPMPAEKALGIMKDEMSNHLDGKLLLLFREMLLDAAVDTAN
ncbi:MAG TPA: HD domain-containing phosphohydrolase [Candidatus Sulfotelmatobacter sp.]|jgi:putative nucleotidyltransferase with HDIG domain|nr:HD domain-containing phosphohydrolase [Candidatus Sulfotelmatobacter sp.]